MIMNMRAQLFQIRFGARYAYNESTRTFDFYHGEPFVDVGEAGQRIEMKVDYPRTVRISDVGNHPEVFSAKGSHGTWASEGWFW